MLAVCMAMVTLAAISITMHTFRRDTEPVMVAATDKVHVELFVMSRCPDAIQMEATLASVVPQVHSIMDLQMNFIGTLNPNKTLGVQCKHGNKECRGNIDELCALRRGGGDLPSFWTFLTCLNNHAEDIGRDPDLSLQCASKAGLDTAAFLSCVTQQEGRDLLKASVETALFSGVTTSATLHIDGKPRCVYDSGWKDCPGGHTASDFIRSICTARGSAPRPSICSEYPD
ncbi:hypothetical protein GGF46_005405 [Coemansia sp. RSA 552]|nr:hypothetical protein GGF46_005405 [Coemansia sp. RSA 552]